MGGTGTDLKLPLSIRRSKETVLQYELQGSNQKSNCLESGMRHFFQIYMVLKDYDHDTDKAGGSFASYAIYA